MAALPAWAADPRALKPAPPVPLNPKTVTAAKGPVKIIFEVANARVREDDSLWVRLTLVNTGTRPMKESSEAFWEVVDLAEGGALRIEVRETKSKKSVSRQKRMDIQWSDELNNCLETYEKDHPESEQPRLWVLKPGAGISTPARPPRANFALRSCEGDPEPKLFPPYGEIPGWDWSEPSYQVRAVYDRRLNPIFDKRLTEEGRKSRPYMILLATEWVTLTKVP